MSRTTVTLPKELECLVEGAVAIGEFSSKSKVIQEALSALFEEDHRRMAAARALYDDGELEAREAFVLTNVDDPELHAALAEELNIDAEEENTQQDILDSLYKDFEIPQNNK